MVVVWNLKWITSNVLLIFGLKIVENSLELNFYKSLKENRRSITSSKENGTNKSQGFDSAIHENGIPHIEINELNPDLREIKILEDAFKNIIAMNGVKYIYKRNFYWRTWREVKDNKGDTLLLCYRCQNNMDGNCTNCNCGYWEIEDSPPCPFEIFSVINRTNMCIAQYNQLNNVNANCISVKSFTDLAKCDNPIESIWRVSRKLDASNVSERYMTVICKERENCEFSTIYSIFPDHITFKLINSSDHIIYSRIMKNGNRNYACLHKCGVIKPKLLFETNSKMAFLAPNNNTENYSSRNDTGDNKIMDSSAKVLSNILKSNGLIVKKNTIHPSIGTTPPTMHCKQLQKAHSEEEYEENEYNDY